MGAAQFNSIQEVAQDLQDGWHRIELPIAADWPRRPLRIIDATLGKPSLTRWRRDDRNDGFHNGASADLEKRPTSLLSGVNLTTRLQLAPVTGRTHQLRVHLSAIGHPIVGDALYAPPEITAGAPRLLLHATQLGLAHPRTGEKLRFDSPAPF
jgi:tRNA pseudouridine32 synthase/23S rRNA pseudouridine746 synthase